MSQKNKLQVPYKKQEPPEKKSPYLIQSGNFTASSPYEGLLTKMKKN